MTDFLKKILLLSLTAIFAVSCADDTIRPETTWLNIYLEDSPASYENATIQFSSAQIFNGTAWIPLTIELKPISLLELTGGTNKSIVSQPIAPGSYTKIKLRFSETGNSLTTTDSLYHLFPMPQFEYLEMEMELDVQKDRYNYMYCDIDAAKTFLPTGNDSYKMEPAGRMINPLLWGAVSGFVTDSKGIRLAQTILVEILQGETTVASTYTNKKTGSFFARLPPGQYQLSILPGPTAPVEPISVSGVVVEAANNHSLGNVIMVDKPVQKEVDKDDQ